MQHHGAVTIDILKTAFAETTIENFLSLEKIRATIKLLFYCNLRYTIVFFQI